MAGKVQNNKVFNPAQTSSRFDRKVPRNRLLLIKITVKKLLSEEQIKTLLSQQ